jgi:hypothetical protein
MTTIGGYENIYQNLLDELESINLLEAAKTLGLACDDSNQVEIPFLGETYRLGHGFVSAPNGERAPTIHGSVLAGYILTRGRGEPAGRFVPLDKLTRLVPSNRNYSDTSLEPRLARYADKDFQRFEQAIEKLGGRPGGDVGSGGKSWIIQPLPKMPVQLIVYEGDDEFPATARLLFDPTATNFLEFEFLAVMAFLLVGEIGRIVKDHPTEDRDEFVSRVNQG